MPNTFAPFGFAQYSGAGSAPTYEQTVASIALGNTTPIFFNDPVMQATNATGLGTGYVAQATGPVTLTVSATGIATTAVGVMTITFTGISSATANLPTFASATWAPPVGAVVVVSNATGVPNGAFTITSATATTAVIANSGSTAAATSSASTPVVTVFVPVAGVFAGCKYLSVSQKRTNWSNYWPGSDAATDVEAYVITDPNARFLVQTGNSSTTATAMGQNQVGQNISFNWQDSLATGETNGRTSTGLSTMFADQATSSQAGGTANSFLPFRIIAIANFLPGQVSPFGSINGFDVADRYNELVVGFNNAMPRNFAGV
jgi:hypothetical protein